MKQKNAKHIKGKVIGINITGRKWFDKVNGNTYFKAYIDLTIKEGKELKRFTEELPFQYGYGEQFYYESVRHLLEKGFFQDLERYENGTYKSFWEYCEQRQIVLTSQGSYIQRKRDM